MRLFLIFFFILISSSVCLSQKKIIKQALKLEKEGLYLEASKKYMDALYRNNTRLESRQGLQRTTQKVMDGMLSEYFRARSSGEVQKAIQCYEDAQAYKKRINYFGIVLNVPGHYESDYREDKETLLNNWYVEAQQASAEGKFDKARDIYIRILSVDPNYKDAIELREAATTAPYFRKGIQAFEGKKYALAWEQFEALEPDDPNYNEAKDYQQKIIASLSTTMSILPAQTDFHQDEWKLRANIIAQISKLKSPFIKLVDRENLDQIIEEQKLGLTGFVNEKTAARVGRILGAKSVLITKVVNYNYMQGGLDLHEKIAYSYRGSSSYPYDNSQFSRITYNEFSQTNTMHVSVQYQLISSETSEVLAADVIHEELRDELVYAEYTGDYNRLYPAKGDLIYKTGKVRQDFLALFSAKRDIASQQAFDFRIQTLAAIKLASSLNDYLTRRY